jgi:hypothetical protein
MARRVLLLFLLVGLIADAQAPAPVFAQVDEILQGLSSITGWRVQRKVPAENLSKDKFKHLVEDSLKDVASNKEVRAQELTLKMFGLVPQEFDLVRESADLVTEQAAAFYDYKKKRLFVLDSTTGNAEQRMALVHELAHALADQQHSLGKYIHDGTPDDDAVTARQAVTEGQASWLTYAYLSFKMGGKPEIPAMMIDELSKQVGASGDDFPVFTKSPLYIRESLIFPYNEGLKFQDAVYREKGMSAFDEVFRHAPSSTQQILHTAKYFANQTPTMPSLMRMEDAAGKEAGRLKTSIDGSLGEFDISALLRQYGNDAEGRATASHWRGGFYRLYEHKSEKYPVLSHVVQWDSSEAAHAYFFLYQKVLRGKWKKVEITFDSETEVSGKGDSGRFVLRLNGDTVQAVEGLR